MSMHKIFFGTIVFFSLGFLAACGGGSGSAGAKGDAGAAGTIAVPSSDTNTFVTAAIDTSAAGLGTITNTYTVTGIDNLSASDSRLRYYLYEGTSATAKSSALSGANVTCSNAGVGSSCGANSPIVIDGREMTTDNATLTLAAHTLDKLDGTITHLIICPGNEAGDAASCNAVALNDRGTKTNIDVSLSGSAAAHSLVGSAGTSVYSIVAFDNGSSNSQAITVGSKVTPPVLSGTASAHVTGENYFLSGQVVSTSSAVYMLGIVSGDGDNISKTTVGGTTVYADNLTGATIWDNTSQAGVWTLDASADSSGNLYATALGDDNHSLAAFSFAATGAQSLTADNSTYSVPNRMPLGAHTGPQLFNNVCSTAYPDAGAIFASINLDNGSQVFLKATSSGWTQPAGTLGVAADNETGHYCAMAFDADGVGYYAGAYDNRTGLALMRSADNFTTVTNIGGEMADPSGNLNDVVLGIDPTSKMPIVAASFGTVAEMWQYDNASGAWTQIGADVVVDTGERIGLAVVDTNTFVMTTTDADNTTITVFYDN